MLERQSYFLSLCTQLGLPPTPQSFVDGAFISGEGDPIALEDPYARVTLAQYPDAGASVVDHASMAAAHAQRLWMSQFSAAERAQVMQDIAHALAQQQAPLAQLEALSAGKPIRDCQVEVAKVVEMFRYYAGYADKLHGEVIPVPSGHLNYTLREPLGVVFQVTPWNAPIFTAGWQIAPAIACGNAVVLKPSEFTPLTSLALAQIAQSAGLPKGLVNVLAGGPATGSAAIAHPTVRKVVFVGAPESGRQVAIAAAQALKPVVLELGGKSANIVFADAHLNAASKGAQAAIFSAAGQSCVAGSRLLVQASIQEQFVAQLHRAIQQFRLGDPLSEQTQIGPLGNARQFAHVTSMIEQAERDGAQVLRAAVPPGDALLVAPTILTGLDENAAAVNCEIFGPVLSVLPFSDEADAIRLANQTDFGLAGAVWTCDGARAHRVAAQVRAGTFWINSYKAIHVSSPFGGSYASGFGRSSGRDALMEYTAAKSIWVDTAAEPNNTFGY